MSCTSCAEYVCNPDPPLARSDTVWRSRYQCSQRISKRQKTDLHKSNKRHRETGSIPFYRRRSEKWKTSLLDFSTRGRIRNTRYCQCNQYAGNSQWDFSTPLCLTHSWKDVRQRKRSNYARFLRQQDTDPLFNISSRSWGQ